MLQHSETRLDSDKVSTTVHIKTKLYEDFRFFSYRHKLSLKEFIERCMFKYVNEEPFKTNINEFRLPSTPYTSSLTNS